MSKPLRRGMKAGEFCEAAPIGYSHLTSLVRRGVIRPVKDGSGDHLFSEADLAVARAAVRAYRRRRPGAGR